LKFTLIQILWIKSLNKSLSFFALDIVIGSYRTYNRSLDGSHHYLISKKISKLQKKKLLQNLYKFPLWYNEKTKMILLKKKIIILFSSSKKWGHCWLQFNFLLMKMNRGALVP